MHARITDWGLALGIAIAFASGVASLASGQPGDWWIFVLHGVAGLWLLPLTAYKLWRTWRRLVLPHRWDRRTIFGLLTTLLVAGTLLSGIWWTTGGTLVIAGYNLLNWHILFGLLLVVAVSAHMLARAKPLRQHDLAGRRGLLRAGLLALGAAALWPAKDAVVRASGNAASQRRFTGSRERGSYAGLAGFPPVSWMFDNPSPVDLTSWQLSINGAVAHRYTLTYVELLRYDDQLEATLDCTGGFFTTQRWRGAQIGRLLDQAQLLPTARWIRFVSVTGYRWSLPLAEARLALLATRIDAATLDHGHGAPVRLVAPGRRGFEWVKWVTQVEVLDEPDAGQLLAIYTSR